MKPLMIAANQALRAFLTSLKATERWKRAQLELEDMTAEQLRDLGIERAQIPDYLAGRFNEPGRPAPLRIVGGTESRPARTPSCEPAICCPDRKAA